MNRRHSPPFRFWSCPVSSFASRAKPNRFLYFASVWCVVTHIVVHFPPFVKILNIFLCLQCLCVHLRQSVSLLTSSMVYWVSTIPAMQCRLLAGMDTSLCLATSAGPAREAQRGTETLPLAKVGIFVRCGLFALFYDITFQSLSLFLPSHKNCHPSSCLFPGLLPLPTPLLYTQSVYPLCHALQSLPAHHPRMVRILFWMWKTMSLDRWRTTPVCLGSSTAMATTLDSAVPMLDGVDLHWCVEVWIQSHLRRILELKWRRGPIAFKRM